MIEKPLKSIPNVQNLIIVPEQIVKQAWDAIDNEPDSGFAIVLQAAEDYKAANMTPMFILDQSSMDIYCFAKETFGKKLH